DEFAVAQMAVTAPPAAEGLAQTIVTALSAPFVLNGHEIASSASVGVALAPEHGSDAGRLLKSADLALYKSKAEGRGRVCMFDPKLDEELRERLKLERTIRDALDNDSFQLYFQPLFGASGSKLVGFEALLRLTGSDGRFIPPSVFIPLAEKMGLIDRIGTWVL